MCSEAERCPKEARTDSGARSVERQVRTWIGLNATIECVAGILVHRSLRLHTRKTEVAGLSAKSGASLSKNQNLGPDLVQIFSCLANCWFYWFMNLKECGVSCLK